MIQILNYRRIKYRIILALIYMIAIGCNDNVSTPKKTSEAVNFTASIVQTGNENTEKSLFTEDEIRDIVKKSTLEIIIASREINGVPISYDTIMNIPVEIEGFFAENPRLTLLHLANIVKTEAFSDARKAAAYAIAVHANKKYARKVNYQFSHDPDEQEEFRTRWYDEIIYFAEKHPIQ